MPVTEDEGADGARSRAAEYARQPSVWPAQNPAAGPVRRRGVRAADLVRGVITAVVLLAGPPWLLWQAFGSPLTLASSWWATTAWSAGSAADQKTGLEIALIGAGWLAWLVLATLLTSSLLAVLRGHRLPRWRLPMPLHRLVFGLTGSAVVLVTIPAGAAVAGPPAVTAPALGAALTTGPVAHPAAPPAHAAPASHLQPSAPETRPRPAASPPTPQGEAASGAHVPGDLVTVSVERSRYDYRVRRGDTLSKIAKTWLGDPDRWPEICSLNKHRHVAGGRKLTDCDLIYPGWNLRLPADAAPPPEAKPRRPSRTPPHPAAPDESGASGPSATSPAPVSRSPEATSPTDPMPPNADSAEDKDGHETAGADLVLPGGSVIPWALATAITATAALVWLQRRRRYRPDDGDDLYELPAPVLAAQHHTRPAIIATRAEPAQTPRLPSGGVGLVGSGADAAARGLIITALTAGTPTEPAQRAEVIIDRPTLTALIGDTPMAAWSRLHIVDDLDQALMLLDTHLLRRARILDEHGLDDIDALRDAVPSEQALPPLLLITHAEEAARSNRARITFGLTTGLDVITIVLGHWPHGQTTTVSDDGAARLEPGSPGPGMQLAVLDIVATRDLLDTVREAQTGEAPLTRRAVQETGGPAAPVTLHEPPAAVSGEPPTKVRLRVLGPPVVEDITLPGRDLRGRAAELAVYLACHPDGADTETIAEYLVPDVRRRQAKQLIHTNASNLRHVLGRAGGAITGGYLLKRGASARYRLDPTTVAVDLWQMRDLLTRAPLASAPGRTELLRDACDLYTAPLAEGCDYEWVEPHREKVRRWGTEAHLLLADDLLEPDPQTASDLLTKAIGLDHYNEELYRKAMQARHALGDADGIRTLLRALTKALADLDAEPADTTTDLATQLRTSLERR